jgi:hypothetical protein
MCAIQESNMRRWLAGLLVVTILLVGGRDTTSAREIRQGDQCLIGANDTVQGDLFVLCRTLNIQGHVRGSVVGAAADAEISGTVDGDVYFAAGQLDASGIFGGNLHFAGSVLRVLPGATFNGPKAHIITLSLSTTLAEGVTIPDSIIAGGYQLVLNGVTGGEVNFWGSALKLNGNVGGDVNATVGDPESRGISQLQTFLKPFNWDLNLIDPGLIVTEGSTLAADLRYTGPVRGTIKGRVNGATDFTQIITQPDLTQFISEQESVERYLALVGQQFIVLAIIGLIGLIFVPRLLQAPVRHAQARPLPSLSFGLLAFIISFPIALIVLLFIVILIIVSLLLHLDGLVVALLGVALVGTWSGGVSIFYFTAIFISRVLLGVILGRGLVVMARRNVLDLRMSVISLLIGTLALSVLMSLPAVGLIFSALAAFLGLGAILIAVQTQFSAYRDSLVNLPPRMPRFTRSLPPPTLDDEPKPPGMENLPEGFTWWKDDE